MEKKYCLNPRFKFTHGNILLDKSTLMRYKLNETYIEILKDIEREPLYIKEINSDNELSRKIIMINQLLEKGIILCVDEDLDFRVIF